MKERLQCIADLKKIDLSYYTFPEELPVVSVLMRKLREEVGFEIEGDEEEFMQHLYEDTYDRLNGSSRLNGKMSESMRIRLCQLAIGASLCRSLNQNIKPYLKFDDLKRNGMVIVPHNTNPKMIPAGNFVYKVTGDENILEPQITAYIIASPFGLRGNNSGFLRELPAVYSPISYRVITRPLQTEQTKNIKNKK